MIGNLVVLVEMYLLIRIKVDRAIGERYGCLPPPRLQNQRPLGVDRLEQIF
jgi:hypothetical protein